MRNLSILLGLTIVLAVVRPAGAAPIPKDLVKAELLADVAAVKPGEEFTLGVRLTIKPKWHIYWKYPGDSGMPTTVKWKLPDSSASQSASQPELRFPLPVRFDQPGDVIGYGYKDEVLLTARVKAPDGPVGSTHEYVADVSWLVCEDVCIPGDALVKLSIPLAEQTTLASQELFAKWSGQLPQPADAASTALKNTQLQRVGERQFQAQVEWPQDQPPKDVQWFPLPPGGSGVEDAQIKSEANRSVLTFALVPAPKDVSSGMQFLVTYTDSNGTRRGVEFNENLPASVSK
jgi:DsbC/DsbD-like thiol-disulfide interchange protein